MVYQCGYILSDESLRMVYGADLWWRDFDFQLTPEQYVGQPDEARHSKRVSVRIKITGPVLSRVPEGKCQAMLYWLALGALRDAKEELTIQSKNAHEYIEGVDVDRVDYPPKAPFQIQVSRPIGFREH